MTLCVNSLHLDRIVQNKYLASKLFGKKKEEKKKEKKKKFQAVLRNQIAHNSQAVICPLESSVLGYFFRFF